MPLTVSFLFCSLWQLLPNHPPAPQVFHSTANALTREQLTNLSRERSGNE